MGHSRVQGNLVLMVLVLVIGGFALITLMGLVPALLVELSQEFGISIALAGQLCTILAVTWGLAAMLQGPFSDRFGRKRILVLGLTIMGIAELGFGISEHFPVLIGFSILAGLGIAMAGPNSLAIVGDYFSAQTQGRMISIVGIGMPLAYLVGVPAGAMIAGSIGWRWSFLLLGVITIVIALATIIALPLSRAHQLNRDIRYLSCFREAFRQKNFPFILIGNTLLQWAYFVIATYLAAFLIQSYFLDTGRVAPFLSLMGVGQLIGMLSGGPVADRLSKTKICAATQALAGIISLGLMLFTWNIWLSVFLGGLFMGLYASNRPSYFALINLMPGNTRGTLMGIQATTNSIGQALGALTGGVILAAVSYSYLGILCLILSLLAAVVFLRISSYSL